MNHSKIGTVEAIMIILVTIVTHTVLSLTRNLINVTYSATLINLVYIGIIAFFFIFLVVKLFKNFPGCDIIDISEILGGKILKTILGIVFIFYFLFTSCILLRNFCEALKIIYYPMTSVLFLIAFFIIAITITNYLDFGATLKTTLIIVPIVLFSIFFLFFANINNFSAERLYPILGNGLMSTFVLGLGNIHALGGICYLYFLPPLLREPEKFKKISKWSVILSILYLILSVSTILLMYATLIENKEMVPLYSAARYIDFGVFFQRLDSIFLLIWILTFACYLSIASKFSIHVFAKLTKIKNAKPIIFPFSMLMLAFTLLPKNFSSASGYENNGYKYFVLIFVFVVCFSILILANIKRKFKKLGVKNE